MTENSTGLVAAPPRPLETAEEREATFKVAKALADSGFFKDAKGANQALAKILIGRDLGLSPAEAMQALHVFDGKVEASADFHATRVKRTPGYDYSVAWIAAGDPDEPGKGTDGPLATASIVGCAITFYAPHLGKEYQPVGTSTFTVDDAKRAGLWDKPGRNNEPGVWQKYPRNMLFARAMSNGVAWFCPEVMGAVRVYSPGEVEDMAPPVGEAAPEMSLIGLGVALEKSGTDPTLLPSIVATVKRAQTLGHAGHGNAATVEMLLRGQPAEKVKAWLIATNADLDLLAGNPDDVKDAQVVEDPAHYPVMDDGEPVSSPDDLRLEAARRREDAAEIESAQAGEDPESHIAALHEEADELDARADVLETDAQPGLEGVE